MSHRLRFVSLVVLLGSAGVARAQDAGVTSTEGETEVTVIRTPPGEDEAPASFDRGLLLRLGAHGHLPVTGPLADIGNTGYGLRAGGGLYVTEHLAASVDLTLSRLPRATDDEAAYLTLGAWLAVRGTVPFEGVLHPFVEVGGGVVLAGPRASAEPSLSGASPVAGLGAAVGLEIDFFEGVSGEGGLRLEHLWTDGLWSSQDGATGNTTMVTPYVALDLYL